MLKEYISSHTHAHTHGPQTVRESRACIGPLEEPIEREQMHKAVQRVPPAEVSREPCQGSRLERGLLP